MKKVTLEDDDFSTLSNICRSAADKFGDFAKECRKAEKAKSAAEAGGMPFGASAGRLAEQFERQRADALRYAELFDMAAEASLLVDPGDEPEASALAP
mgnify:CR=1 FL=1